MTVSELKSQLEKLESHGRGGTTVVVQVDYQNSLIEIGRCGTVEAWPHKGRLAHGEFRTASQGPDRSEVPVTVVIVQ